MDVFISEYNYIVVTNFNRIASMQRNNLITCEWYRWQLRYRLFGAIDDNF